MTAPPPPPGADAPLTESAPSHGARPSWRSALPVVSMAVAVLVAGGGSAYWAATAHDDGGGPGTDTEAEPRPLRLDGFALPERAVASQTTENGAPAPAYRAVKPLPDDTPGRTPVYRSSGSSPQDTVTALARALRLSDSPRRVPGGWQVGGDTTGRDASLWVAAQPSGSWVYTRGDHHRAPTGGGRDDATASTSHDAAAGGAPQLSSPAAPTEAEPVSPPEAERAVAPVLRTLGLDDDRVDARLTRGATRVVTVEPEYGGLPTHGWETELHVDAEGTLVGGSGPLANLRQGASYPVLSARETLRNLNQRMSGWSREPCYPERPVTAPNPAAEPEPADPRAPSARTSSRTAGEHGEVTRCDHTRQRPTRVYDAVFGLARHSVRGQPVLVPSWLFRLEPAAGTGHRGSTLSHPALAPRYLLEEPSKAAPGDGGVDRGTPPSQAPGTHGSPDVSVTEVERYDARDRTLTLRFWGGQCTDYTGVAKETEDTVRVRIVARPPEPGVNCVAVAKRLTVEVPLDTAVGNRKVVDQRGSPLPRS